jgi:hypothetical protein
MQNSETTLEYSLAVSSKVNIFLSFCVYLREFETYIHTNEKKKQHEKPHKCFIAALFVMGKMWKYSRCPSAGEWTVCRAFRQWNPFS